MVSHCRVGVTSCAYFIWSFGTFRYKGEESERSLWYPFGKFTFHSVFARSVMRSRNKQREPIFDTCFIQRYNVSSYKPYSSSKCGWRVRTLTGLHSIWFWVVVKGIFIHLNCSNSFQPCRGKRSSGSPLRTRVATTTCYSTLRTVTRM